MSEIQNKVVIITGASSGLGEATAKRLAASGAKLMLAARREDRLKELVAAIAGSGGTANYLVTDVTDRAQVEALAQKTSEGLRLESNGEIRSTNISPGAVATELTTTISDRDTAARMNAFYKIAIDADSIARAIAFAIEQPSDVAVNEMIIRPTLQ